MATRLVRSGLPPWRVAELHVLQTITGLFVGFGAYYGIYGANRVLVIAIVLALAANAAAWRVQGVPKGWWLTLLAAAAVLLGRDLPLVGLPNCSEVTSQSTRCTLSEVWPRVLTSFLGVALAVIGAVVEMRLDRRRLGD